MKKEIFGLTPEALQQEFAAVGLKKFRAAQVYQWLYKKSVFKFADMRNISKADIAVLEENFTVLPAQIKILTRWQSSDNLTEKLLLELADGNSVETVLMHHDYGYSVCVSSQVGCAMGCAFCASGLNGCVRNLTAAEIIMQVYLFNAMIAPQQVSRVVVMGSGEPMLNYDEVLGALKFLHREDTLFMSYRNMTVSTCGIIPGIERLTQEAVPINLAISLHAVKNDVRTELMRGNKGDPFPDVIAAAEIYAQAGGWPVSDEDILSKVKNWKESLSNKTSYIRRAIFLLICKGGCSCSLQSLQEATEPVAVTWKGCLTHTQ